MGVLQAATDSPDEDKDIVLGHPWFWDSTRFDWRAENMRFIYIPASRIEFVSLAPIGDEKAQSGYLSDSQLRSQGENEDVERLQGAASGQQRSRQINGEQHTEGSRDRTDADAKSTDAASVPTLDSDADGEA
jgi:hypothetical protein